jgi:hypothetical protein
MTTDPDETEDRPNPDRVYKDEQRKHLEARKLRRKNEDKIEGLFDSLQRLGELGTVRDGTLVVEKGELGLNKRALHMLVKHLVALGLRCSEDDQDPVPAERRLSRDVGRLEAARHPRRCRGRRL